MTPRSPPSEADSVAPDGLAPDRAELLTALSDLDHAFYAVWRALDDEGRRRRPSPGSWSVCEIVHHLVAVDGAYLEAMRSAVEQKQPPLAEGRPIRSGFFERLFIAWLEPPVGWKAPAPKNVLPPIDIDAAATWSSYQSIHGDLRSWIRETGRSDLNRVRFPNPFVPGVAFRVGSGLRILLAHGRRHLAQGRRVAAWSSDR